MNCIDPSGLEPSIDGLIRDNPAYCATGGAFIFYYVEIAKLESELGNLQSELLGDEVTLLMREIGHELKLVFGNRIVLNAEKSIFGYWSEQGLRRLAENLISNASNFVMGPVTSRLVCDKRVLRFTNIHLFSFNLYSQHYCND